jgi:hypothetical protein
LNAPRVKQGFKDSRGQGAEGFSSSDLISAFSIRSILRYSLSEFKIPNRRVVQNLPKKLEFPIHKANRMQLEKPDKIFRRLSAYSSAMLEVAACGSGQGRSEVETGGVASATSRISTEHFP